MPELSEITPGLIVLHGNRMEDLRALAVKWMQDHPLAPLESEVILVQSNGIAQWLKLALAADPRLPGAEQGLSVAAALELSLPAGFIWSMYRAVLGNERLPERDVLNRDSLIWRNWRLLQPGQLGPDFAALQQFLQTDRSGRKRYQLAEKLADLYDQYQVYRADWLDAWARGQDVLFDAQGQTLELPTLARWQAQWWRLLLQDINDPAMHNTRAGVHRAFLEVLEQSAERPAQLPRRVMVFGLSALPAQSLEALAALSKFMQVMVFVHNPCQHFWGDIIEDRDLLRAQYRRQARKPGLPALLEEDQLHQYAQPLLAAWGKQGRDYIGLMDQFDGPLHAEKLALFQEQRLDWFGSHGTDTVLQQLQDDILELRPLAESREIWADHDGSKDRSVCFHVAHSPLREVEILHDQLLDYFSQDPTLQPKDVIVMVPDIQAYAPHIQAVFGLLDRKDSRYLPYTLADLKQRGNDPLMIALEQLLELPETKLTLSQIVDWLDVPAFRQRFGMSQTQLPLAKQWLQGAGIRWGLDSKHRQSWGLDPAHSANTWVFGLRRLLLGYAMHDERGFGDTIPYREVGGLDATLIGALSKLVKTLAEVLERLSEPATPMEWAQHIEFLLDHCFAAETDAEQALLARLHTQTESWLEQVEHAQVDTPIPLAVFRESWLSRVDQAQLSQRFMAGAINFCTLVPMRAIPFRVVCLLGMSEGAFPRVQERTDFDLMARHWRPGDRARRDDDRYLLLEALLSARERFYLSWVGRRARDNAECPPSVLVGQLRDHLSQVYDREPPGILSALTTEHPLQPFSRRYFAGDASLFTYAREWLPMMEPSSPAETRVQPLSETALPEPVDIEMLVDLLRDPVGCWSRRRLHVQLPEHEQGIDNDEPFLIAGLSTYQLTQPLLGEFLRSSQPEQPLEQRLDQRFEQLIKQGQLPFGPFAAIEQNRIQQQLLALHQSTQVLFATPPQALEPRLLEYRYEQGRVVGSLGPTYVVATHAEPSQVELSYFELGLGEGAQPKFKRFIGPWLRQVLANACGYPLQTYFVGPDGHAQFAPLPAEQAAAVLQHSLALYRQSLRTMPYCAAEPGLILAQLIDTPPAPEAGEALNREAQEAVKKALLTVQGSPRTPGLLQRNPYLYTWFPDLAEAVTTPRFLQWSRALYAPLIDHFHGCLNGLPELPAHD